MVANISRILYTLSSWALMQTISNEINLEATELFKVSRRLRLLLQTRKTRRRRNSFVCRVVKHWNCLPLAVSLAPDQRHLKIYLTHAYTSCFCSFILFSPQRGLLGKLSLPDCKIHTFRHTPSHVLQNLRTWPHCCWDNTEIYNSFHLRKQADWGRPTFCKVQKVALPATALI